MIKLLSKMSKSIKHPNFQPKIHDISKYIKQEVYFTVHSEKFSINSWLYLVENDKHGSYWQQKCNVAMGTINTIAVFPALGGSTINNCVKYQKQKAVLEGCLLFLPFRSHHQDMKLYHNCSERIS